jgi:hypothetical protein
MDVVNVVMTCRKLADPPPDVPFVEVKNGVMYYFLKGDVKAAFFRTGKVKVFSRNYPPPPLPYYGDCRVENVVARTTVPAGPPDEMKELLERHGFIVSDREKVNAKLAYVQGLRATVRIFPRPGVARYKAMIFAPSPEVAAEVERLLASALG